jgi:hypothetical protein
MAITDPIGFIAACSSASGRGITGAGAAADTAGAADMVGAVALVMDTVAAAATGTPVAVDMAAVAASIRDGERTVADIAAA